MVKNVAGLASLGFTLASCSIGQTSKLPLDHPPLRATSAKQVAFVEVAATGALAWDQIADSLQTPLFNPTQESLLADAAQVTSSVNARSYDALAASVAATVAGTTKTQTAAVSTDATGATTRTSNTQSQTQTPAAPTIENLNVTAAPTDFSADPSGSQAGTEAQLKYQVARALAEEIAILNKQVSSLVYVSGYRPYFVSVQLTVLPLDRGYPYDTYLDLRFVTVGNQSPIVVPLLITDSIENTRESQLANVVRDLGAELKGSGGLFGASASLKRTLARLDASLSLRPNSLLAVGKEAPDTLKVRLGANALGETFEMVPRTHIVSLVLLVPLRMAMAAEGAERRITISPYVQYRDALSNVYHGPPESPLLYKPRDEWFEIPRRLAAVCPEQQSVPLVAGSVAPAGSEAGIQVQVASVNGGAALEGRRLQASLTFSNGNKEPIHLVASEIRPNASGLQITFADPTPFLTGSGEAHGSLHVKILETGDGESSQTCPEYSALLARPSTAALHGQSAEAARAGSKKNVATKGNSRAAAAPASTATPPNNGAEGDQSTGSEPANATGPSSRTLNAQSVPPPVTIPPQ